ncbi:hypothetical protein N657DRAFT_634839 [Parathielavia appendiculata]|uniref:CBF1-interacting co-repressor CIR N-terminal domain-containing protein n=1 Tax=Parathielavia appendiculata TaxID=2587402 RepID=A0AAN6U008_9PEZI|nr:hypothetical protein N657DRAFT_634839 [Parathielavia appendiculata]
MPLHLLGKKSWNVYNPANIARVRRDEEAARAREEAEEQRMQEADAARRLAILRGEIPPPLDSTEPEAALPPSRSRDWDNASSHTGTSRKRKRHGEDDTDFEMRIARERASVGGRAARELAAPTPLPSTSLTSLVDSKGHISLFSEAEVTARPRERNEEAARKERELEGQYQMRFVNAAGKEGLGLTDGGPWYASVDGEASGALVPSKNVWGGEDPKRKVREAARLDASDPLAMMKRGAKMVRELEKERRKEVKERERELMELEKEERRERRRRERRRRREEKDRAGRGRRTDESERDDGLDKRARYQDDSVHRGRKRDQSKDRQRHSRDRRDTRGDSPDRRERYHRHHEERLREKGQKRDRQREHRHESRHLSVDERNRRPYHSDHEKDRNEPDSKQR